MDFGGRKELFKALVGSHNYNLNTETSDRDYKVFVVPTFDDLYFNNQFSKSYVGETEDFDCHDVRKVSSLWWKANVNFLEVLFSNDVIYGNFKPITHNLIDEIFNMKNEIAVMNLSYLYDACVGMHLNKKKLINKGTEGTQYLVDKYGYDTKQAMHSLRILCFLKRFADNNFTDFKKAIWFNSEELDRQILLDVKNGKFDKEKYYSMSENLLNFIESEYKQEYKSKKPNEETNQKLLKLVKAIVKTELF